MGLNFPNYGNWKIIITFLLLLCGIGVAPMSSSEISRDEKCFCITGCKQMFTSFFYRLQYFGPLLFNTFLSFFSSFYIFMFRIFSSFLFVFSLHLFIVVHLFSFYFSSSTFCLLIVHIFSIYLFIFNVLPHYCSPLFRLPSRLQHSASLLFTSFRFTFSSSTFCLIIVHLFSFFLLVFNIITPYCSPHLFLPIIVHILPPYCSPLFFIPSSILILPYSCNALTLSGPSLILFSLTRSYLRPY